MLGEHRLACLACHGLRSQTPRQLSWNSHACPSLHCVQAGQGDLPNPASPEKPPSDTAASAGTAPAAASPIMITPEQMQQQQQQLWIWEMWGASNAPKQPQEEVSAFPTSEGAPPGLSSQGGSEPRSALGASASAAHWWPAYSQGSAGPEYVSVEQCSSQMGGAASPQQSGGGPLWPEPWLPAMEQKLGSSLPDAPAKQLLTRGAEQMHLRHMAGQMAGGSEGVWPLPAGAAPPLQLESSPGKESMGSSDRHSPDSQESPGTEELHSTRQGKRQSLPGRAGARKGAKKQK